MNELVERLYLPGTRKAREDFFAGIGGRLVSDSVNPPELELFLIFFSALGVQMTEPVEGWIRDAGRRCEAVGYGPLGRALQKHAVHEANHHLMMIEDTRALVAHWNERHSFALDAEALLASPPTDGIAAYVRLHEDVIAGPAPFCQLAIEYEIEGLSVSLGPGLIAQCKRRLGADVVSCLSFVTEHVAVDVGHTKFNESQLERLLSTASDASGALADAGSRALAAYGRFLGDCLERATDTYRKMSTARGTDAA